MSKRNLVCDSVSYSFDTKRIFSNISLSIGDEKIGLVGSNGVGKSTLIRLLVGQLQPQSGTIIINGTIGYLSQHFHAHQEDSIAHVLGIEQKLSALERIQAGTGTPDDFACILMGETPPQLIILDEPTNNMDLDSITSMEQAL